MAKAISNFHELIASLSTRNERKRVAVVWPEDESTQYSVGLALDYGLIDVICVGCERQVRSNEHLAPYAEHFSFVDAADRDEAARLSVQLVREGKADILMKGLINTDNLLRAVLDRQTGILPEGRVLTHVTAATIPSYPKMLFFTDSAVIPYPTNAQRRQQVMYVADVCRSFGIAEPRISLIHCTEKVSQKHFPFTVHYRELAEAAQRGEFGPCIVDGPLDLKTSVSIESMRTKASSRPSTARPTHWYSPTLRQPTCSTRPSRSSATWRRPECCRGQWHPWCCPHAATASSVSSTRWHWPLSAAEYQT